jgi:hypothetical protein
MAVEDPVAAAIDFCSRRIVAVKDWRLPPGGRCGNDAAVREMRRRKTGTKTLRIDVVFSADPSLAEADECELRLLGGERPIVLLRQKAGIPCRQRSLRETAISGMLPIRPFTTCCSRIRSRRW